MDLTDAQWEIIAPRDLAPSSLVYRPADRLPARYVCKGRPALGGGSGLEPAGPAAPPDPSSFQTQRFPARPTSGFRGALDALNQSFCKVLALSGIYVWKVQTPGQASRSRSFDHPKPLPLSAIVPAFCADPVWAHKLARASPNHGFDLLHARHWGEFERLYDRGSRAVAAVACLRNPDLTTSLAALRERHPLIPAVVVTQPAPENLRLLASFRAEQMVFWFHPVEVLFDAVARAVALPLRERLAQAMERLGHLPGPMRRALADCCRSATPVHTVTRFRILADMPRSTLNDRWRAALDAPDRPRIEDVLHRIELIRASELRAQGLRVSDLPERLGIGERTLERRRRESGRGLTGALAEELAAELLGDLRPRCATARTSGHPAELAVVEASVRGNHGNGSRSADPPNATPRSYR